VLITRPEESYRVVYVCDSEASIMIRPWPTRGCCAIGVGGYVELQNLPPVNCGLYFFSES
jgi:hypothetical protein